MTHNRRRELARNGICPTCGEEYKILAAHWRGKCSPPGLSDRQRALVAGLLLGNGCVAGNGANKHFQLTTRWRPFAAWVFRELGWLAANVVRFDDSRDDRPDDAAPAQQYFVRTHAHPGLTRFRSWYASAEDADSPRANPSEGSETHNGVHRTLPIPEELPAGRLTPRIGRAWHATAGTLGWSNLKYATTRQAYFSAQEDARAEAVATLFESIDLQPTRAGKGVQLSPTQTAEWLDWIGESVPGVEYKWAADHEEYETAKDNAEALRSRLWSHPEMNFTGALG